MMQQPFQKVLSPRRILGPLPAFPVFFSRTEREPCEVKNKHKPPDKLDAFSEVAGELEWRGGR